GRTAPSRRRGAPGRSAAPRSQVAQLRAVARSLMVAPLPRDGAGLRVARLRLAPRSPISAPSRGRSWSRRSLATARGSGSLGCPSLPGRPSPRRRSVAHGRTAPSRRRGAPGRSAAPRSQVAQLRAVARSLMVAPLPRDGAGLRVARLRLAPRSPISAPSLGRSWSHRSLATARGSVTLGFASLPGRPSPRRRSVAHGRTAPSRRRGAPGRSAAPRSQVAQLRAVARSLMVAPLPRDGAGLRVARLPLAPRSPNSAPSLGRSWSHRSLATARGSGSLGCPSLPGRPTPRRRSVAHGRTAPSRRRGAPGRSAAPRSQVAQLRAVARSLMVAPLPRAAPGPPVARLPVAPRSPISARPLGRSWSHRSLATARGSGSLGCPSLPGRPTPRRRSVAHGGPLPILASYCNAPRARRIYDVDMSLPRPTRAVVTGAGSGLGRALCEELGARGAGVLASDIDEAAARAPAAACRAEAVRCDVSRLADVEALADEADRRLGGVDLVVNNAGVATVGRVGDVPIADWEWL